MIQRLFSAAVVLWLMIGVLATFQRGYFSTGTRNCAHFGTVAVNVLAGPLNYTGANPQVHCVVPEPSR